MNGGKLPWFIAAWILLCPQTRAAAPVVDYLFPSGGQQGTTVKIATTAKADVWPVKVWTDAAGLKIEASEATGELVAKIAADCPIGPHVLRIYNSDGVAQPRFFVVDRHVEFLEKEPNNSLDSAQPIAQLPAIVNGQLEKPGDVDCFAIDAKAAQWIVAELTCRRLGAPIDPVMHLYGPDGIEVAFNHDTFGLDPLIAWRAKSDGRYVIEVVGFQYPPGVDVRFAGSKSAVYRLLITTGPYARYAFPAGAQRGTKTPMHLMGWNLGTSGNAVSLEFDGLSLASRAEFALIAPPSIHNSIRIAIDDLPERLEVEPNDSPDTAQAIDVPAIINGRIGQPGDMDRFRFTASKGEQFTFAIRSAALDFPLDAVLSIEDKSGKPIVTVDDTGASPDPKMDWTAPAAGEYLICVSDRFGKGGDAYVYRLQISHPVAGFTAAVDVGALRVEPGKSSELQVTVSRMYGRAQPLAVVLDGLPPGVTAPATSVPAAGGAVKITVSAATEAKPASVPIHATVVSLDPEHPVARYGTVALAADSIVSQIDTIWLTVPPTLPATKPAQ